jgi:hypothetical protein
MAIWCTYCDAQATHLVEETQQPLCRTCATSYKAGQSSPDTSVVPIPEFEVIEYADELRELTYYLKALSAEHARQIVEEGQIGPTHNKAVANLDGLKPVEIKSVKRL